MVWLSARLVHIAQGSAHTLSEWLVSDSCVGLVILERASIDAEVAPCWNQLRIGPSGKCMSEPVIPRDQGVVSQRCTCVQ